MATTQTAKVRGATARREEIVSIAMGLFAKGGSHAVSVREIADHAGILSGSLYTHFKSKTEILDLGIRPYTEAVLQDLREITEMDEPPRVIVQLLIRRSFERVVEWQDAASIMYTEWNSLTNVDDFAYLREFGVEVQNVWLTVLRAAIADGSLADDVDPEVVFRLMREVLAGVARRYRPGSRYTPRLMADYFDRMVFSGLALPQADGES